ncbi:hypothetical protein lerEdw1_019490 [Lerista edwardsae]|nr:hypothetical protein lerEdw1_019490 [Lerista edwardsae]
MAWALCFLAVLCTYSGVRSDVTLTQLAAKSVSPGQVVTLPCTIIEGVGTTPWYQQKVGERPRFLFYGSDNRGEGVPGRFSASRSENVNYLTISNVQPEDEADYYCSIWYSSRNMIHSSAVEWGTETKTFTSPPQALSPSFQQLQTLKNPELVVPEGDGPSFQQLQALKNPEFVSVGGTVTLSCLFSSGNIGDGNYRWWAQQKDGGVLRAMMYTTSTRPSDVPARFTGSRSGNVMSLTITGALVEDEADYYYPSFQQLQPVKNPECVSVGGTVTLSCLFSGGAIADDNYPFWFQQKDGAVPRLMMYYTSIRPSDVPARFSGSRSGNTMSLTITGALLEDEAVYYCCVWARDWKEASGDPSALGKLSSSSTMVWLLHLCTVLASIGPSFQQLQSVKNTEFVSSRGTVTLSCRLNSGNIVDSNYPWWTQQKDGAIPRMVMDITSRRPPDVPARFSGSRSGNTLSLTITGALPEDEAVYYCSVWTGNSCTVRHSDGEVGQKLAYQLKLSKGFKQMPEHYLLGILQLWAASIDKGLGLMVFPVFSDSVVHQSLCHPDSFQSAVSLWKARALGPSFQELQKLKKQESVPPGETITLSCRFSCGALSDDNYPLWLQQHEENVPRLVLYNTRNRPSSIPARFSGARTGNTMSLSITGVLEEDEADYYCVVWSGSERPSGTLAQFVLTQPFSVSAPLGDTVHISCSRSSGNIASYDVSWHQQKSGHSPRLVMYAFSRRPMGIPERFSGSVDSASNSATLTISNLQEEDKADYYCLSYGISEAEHDGCSITNQNVWAVDSGHREECPITQMIRLEVEMESGECSSCLLYLDCLLYPPELSNDTCPLWEMP